MNDIYYDEDLDELLTLQLKASISEVCADIVTLREHGLKLKKVLLDNPGTWHDLRMLSSLDHKMQERLNDFYNNDNNISLTWLEYPDYSPTSCIILFFVPNLVWSWSAIYNREYNLELY